MSPPFIFLGVSSTIIIWVITTLGLNPHYWTFCVVPSLSIFFLCDHQKLLEAVGEIIMSPKSGSIGVAVLSVLYVDYVPWKLVILLTCVFCLLKAFSYEKMMYMGDICGELSKSFVWKIAGSFSVDANRMMWSGDWAYCCPYSRKLICRDINHYYTLKPESRESSIPEPFVLDFVIEACKIKCTYTDGGGYTGSEIEIHDAEWLTLNRSLAGISISDKLGFSPRRADGAVDGGSSSETDGESDKQYVCTPGHENKLEVTLLQEDNELEGYTFYQSKPGGVVEVKRALEILRDHGNLIYSSVHRKIGSHAHRAHARCYEFHEIFDLILNRGYRLHKVALQSTYTCCISGSKPLVIVNIAVVVWMNYYQLNAAPKKSLITMLVMYALIQVCLQILGLFGQKNFLKRWLYRLIAFFAHDRVERVYSFFLVKCPFLTFCNESYGYPLMSASQTRVCCFRGLSLPRTDCTFSRILNRSGLEVVPSDDIFDLRTLSLELKVYYAEDQLCATVNSVRKFDNFSTCMFIGEISEIQITYLRVLLRWLEEHQCVGICKEMPRRDLMHVYSYREIVDKVLKEGARPQLVSWVTPTDLWVEGLC